MKQKSVKKQVVFFTMEIHPNAKFHKFKYCLGSRRLCFTSIPTKEEAIEAFDLEMAHAKKEKEWTNQKYFGLNKAIEKLEGEKQCKERKKFDKVCRKLLVKYGPSQTFDWTHTGALSQAEKEGSIRLFINKAYVVKKKKVTV